MKKTKAKTAKKGRAKTGKAKTARSRSRVKDLSAKKAATVRGGLPAVQKVRDAAVKIAPDLPTEQLAVNYVKIKF
jgi:hypothetical protein